MPRSAQVALLIVAVGLDAPAFACGGFFCDTNTFGLPAVDQSAERILFAVDPDGEVDMDVQISYQGESDDFAWVVPTPGLPQLSVSSDAIFAYLDRQARAVIQLEYVEPDRDCYPDQRPEESDADTDADGDESVGVEVIARETIGPYETVILQANNATTLTAWLDRDGYDLPDGIDTKLAPYVAQDQYFVALKLASGNDVGDLRPLGLHYRSTGVGIPIQLTSIAAVPDMRLEVHVLGAARAVPDNYLHVTINEAALSWFDRGSNYNDTISLAADEAGGQAFATDFSGPTDTLPGFFDDSRFRPEELRVTTDPFTWLQLVLMVVPSNSDLLALLQDVMPEPQAAIDAGITPQQYYGCLYCYAGFGEPVFDPLTATDAFETRMIVPLRRLQGLLDTHPHLTRLTSSMDAIEMTRDPTFVVNADLPQVVSNVHHATVALHCTDDDPSTGNAERTLILDDGREIELPSQAALQNQGTNELAWMDALTDPKAILIEDFGASGSGEVLFDWRDQAAEAAEAFNRDPDGPGPLVARRYTCGCGPSGLAPAWLLAGIGLLAARRRR